MQTQSPQLTQQLATMFGSRLPEAQTAALRADLAACRASLRNGSKTFLAASLLLPRGVHEPASALYAFCRLADDAVDARGDRRDAVERLRERLHLAYAGTPQDDPADRALAVVVAQHHIPAALFDGLLEGFVWDLQGRRYDTLDALHDYAARVAGTVGAMMALLMGVRSAEGLARACDLGVAMQLSNIARDVGEDARMGRLYLPREWMVAAGLDPDTWLARPVFSPALGSVVQRVLDAADVLYERVDAGVARLPLACRPGINAARFMYAAIGHEVARRGLDSVSARARVSGARKVWLLLRSVAQLAPPASACALPPLAANRFLVDAAMASAPRVEPPARRGLADRVVWTAELFARLETRDRLRRSDLAT
ncbi:MAG: phytoene/squalene synthase family protein [Burkholderiales bacterium]